MLTVESEELGRIDVSWSSGLNFSSLWLWVTELRDTQIVLPCSSLNILAMSFFHVELCFITVVVNFVIELMKCKEKS